MTGAGGQENITHRECLIAFDEVLNEVKAELKCQGREDEFVGAKVKLFDELESKHSMIRIPFQ